MGRAIKVPITPAVLRWAIDSSGYSPDEVAAELGLHESTVRHWLRGDDRPTVTQFRNLAHLLRRPTAVFLLPSPPQESVAPVQFRPAPGEASRILLPEEHLRIREAERLQRALAWLAGELGESLPNLPRIKGGTAAEHAAAEARTLLGVPVAKQLSPRSLPR